MPKRFLMVWTIFAILVSVQITGCSLIGFGVGSAIDSGRRGKMRPGDQSTFVKLEPGSRLIIRKLDGSTIAGTYRGLVAEPDSSYILRYNAWCDTAEVGFRPPRIGESVRIQKGNEYSMESKEREGTFLGFGPSRVHYRARDSKATYEPFTNVRRIRDASGHVISKDAITQVARRLPVQLIVVLRQGPRESRVDLLDAQVVGLQFADVHHGFRNAGLIVGVAADATIIVAAAALSAAASSTSCEPSYSGGYYTDSRMPPAFLNTVPDSIYVLPQLMLAAR